jgi:ParB-like chromosome segregation protein Spo0J
MSGSENTLDKVESRIVKVKLRDLKLLEKNARYMTPQEFSQLVANIKQDGKLMGVPVVYRGEVLSGNHRVRAAIKAGIEEADVLDVLTELPEERRLAIQLSQNAINGKDDPNILAQLYTSLNSLEWKRYSGVTDDAFKCTDEKLAALGITRPKYEELSIVFLPEEKTAFIDFLARIETSKKAQVLVGELATFNALFDAIVRVKQEKKVINNAVALRLLAELAVSALDAEKIVPAAAMTTRKIA